ncbi:MAG: hypothetical protein ACLR0U_07425 [Enterocloster clostridioformis]
MIIVLLVAFAPVFTDYAPDEAIARTIERIYSNTSLWHRSAMDETFSAERFMEVELPLPHAFLHLEWRCV